MQTQRKEIKPLDLNNEFRDINPIILNYLSTASLLTTLKKCKEEKDILDPYDLSIRRYITERARAERA